MKQAARSMMIARLKAIAAAVLAIATLAGLATGLAASRTGGDDERPSPSRPIVKDDPAPQAVADRAKAGEGEMIAFRGRVLAPGGKPAAGAGIYTVATRSSEGWAGPVLKTRAGADGSFRFTLPRAELDGAGVDRPWSMVTVVADADGLGPDWVELKQPPDGELVLQLVDDSVPIAGRILDLQGRPVVGAKVTLSRIVAEGAGRDRPLSEAAPRGSVPGIES